jgi:hypothetical protein
MTQSRRKDVHKLILLPVLSVSKNLKLGAFTARASADAEYHNPEGRKEGCSGSQKLVTLKAILSTVTKPISGSKTGSDPPSSQDCDLPRMTPNSEHKFGTST